MAKYSEELNTLFYELIRVAIGTQASLSRTPLEVEWEELFDLAVKQSLAGICFVGIHNIGADSDDGFAQISVSENLFFNWMGIATQINMTNEAINLQCADLQKRLSADGFRSCILKGLGVATLYRQCENDNYNNHLDGSIIHKLSTVNLAGFRQSGDIDIWVDANKEKVIDYVMKKYPTKDFGLRHIQFRCFPDTEVELHWIPVSSNNIFRMRILRRYFDNMRDMQFLNRVDGLCVPTDDFQVVHQLLHVYGHYVYEGVGLRQMMDLYFAQLAVRNNENEDDIKSKVIKLFNKLGLMRFVAATQWVLQDVFGMSEGVLLCTPDKKEGRKLLDEIMIGGNFGHYDERNHVANESFIRRFFRRWGRKFRMLRFDPLGILIMPFSRIKLELWMRSVRRKYNV